MCRRECCDGGAGLPAMAGWPAGRHGRATARMAEPEARTRSPSLSERTSLTARLPCPTHPPVRLLTDVGVQHGRRPRDWHRGVAVQAVGPCRWAQHAGIVGGQHTAATHAGRHACGTPPSLRMRARWTLAPRACAPQQPAKAAAAEQQVRQRGDRVEHALNDVSDWIREMGAKFGGRDSGQQTTGGGRVAAGGGQPATAGPLPALACTNPRAAPIQGAARRSPERASQ